MTLQRPVHRSAFASQIDFRRKGSRPNLGFRPVVAYRERRTPRGEKLYD
jgi:hypothetical protein